jgi:hypothetical protein
MTAQLRNVVQCPACGFKTTEQMPLQRKVMSYQCPACQVVTSATEQECCIYCKLGRLPCPAKQAPES